MLKRKTPGFDVMAALKELIEDPRTTEHGRLPAERELAQRLGISRAQLRTGLSRLEAEDRIWRHVGKGTFVGPKPRIFSDESAIADVTSPREIIEARLVLRLTRP